MEDFFFENPVRLTNKTHYVSFELGVLGEFVETLEEQVNPIVSDETLRVCWSFVSDIPKAAPAAFQAIVDGIELEALSYDYDCGIIIIRISSYLGR